MQKLRPSPFYLKLLALGTILMGFYLPSLAQTPPNPPLEPPHTEESPLIRSDLKITPQNIMQGETLKVSFSTENEASAPYSIQLNQQKFALYPTKTVSTPPDFKYEAYLAIKADQKPGGYTLRILDKDGVELYQPKIEVISGKFYTQSLNIQRPKPGPEIEALLKQENDLVQAAANIQSPEALWDGPFILPVPHRVTAAYGTRRYLNGKYNGYHSGVDFASPHGYPIKAPANAKVTLARYFSKYNDNGNTVFLDHGQGVTSVYIHLSKIPVKEGQSVRKGETIGYIGTTGRSTGPHLHWGMYINGHNTDGLKWIQRSQKDFLSQQASR